MNSILLFSKDKHTKEEYEFANKHCNTILYRSQCPKNALVYSRYGCLPKYKELDDELKECHQSSLINSYEQHQYIANFDYYYDVEEFTFPSWNNLNDTIYPGPFVIKGKTNSRKHQWKTHMFAEDKKRAIEIASELHNDGLLGYQELIYRKYIPLKTFETGVNGMPFSNEWRFFYLGTKKLAHGFYWSGLDDLSKVYITDQALKLADEIAAIVSEHVNFFVLDIAEKEDNNWILVEVNDAQMSGTSLIDLDELYGNLAKEASSFIPI